MLRKTLRERREYLFLKSRENKDKYSLKRARQLDEALKADKPIPTELRTQSGAVQASLDLLDTKRREESTHVDNEYALCGYKDPKVLITTSRSPSSRLTQFAKELCLIIPNAERLNRGSYVLKDLVEFCKTKDVSDMLLIYETRGRPRRTRRQAQLDDHIAHAARAHGVLPALRRRAQARPAREAADHAYPHLMFHNFTSPLGERIRDIIRYMFPPPNTNETRILSFVNERDRIAFRHHVWSESKGAEKKVALKEIGPRFVLRPYKIELGTVDMRDLETEWVLRPYFNTHKPILTA